MQYTDLDCELPTEYVEGDYAIVQSPDWSTLFVLSRVQNVTSDKLDVSTWQAPFSNEAASVFSC